MTNALDLFVISITKKQKSPGDEYECLSQDILDILDVINWAIFL